MSFQKASKSKSKLRAAIFGPAGAGKTFTSLSIATGMGNKIALIDSERGSANKYADRFNFDIAELNVKSIDEYVKIINEASGKYNVLIIDSLTHAWNELLEEVDKIAKVKYKGNTWSAWSEGNPKQKKLINALLSFPGHIIATMRSRTEWQTSTDVNGKVKPTRVGLAPEQGKGIEYEFDLLMELTTEHMGSIIKDRTSKYQDKIIEYPGEVFGKELSEWLNTGVDIAPKQQTQTDPGKHTPAVLKNPKGEIELPQGNHADVMSKLNKCKSEAHLLAYQKIREAHTWTPAELKEQDDFIIALREQWKTEADAAANMEQGDIR